MLDGDRAQAVPWEEQGPLGGDRTLELSPAVLQHRWPEVVARDPLSEPCASTGEPGPCKPMGRQRTRVPGCVAGPQHPRGLMCGCPACTAGSSCLSCSSPAPRGGVQGAGSPCTEQGHCTEEGAAPLQPPPRGSHCLGWWSHPGSPSSLLKKSLVLLGVRGRPDPLLQAAQGCVSVCVSVCGCLRSSPGCQWARSPHHAGPGIYEDNSSSFLLFFLMFDL